jgi:hypothetical protein
LVLLGDDDDNDGDGQLATAGDDGGEEVRRRLPIFSFLIRWAPPLPAASASAAAAPVPLSSSLDGGRFLHYNFVGALLNDLFGVQVRRLNRLSLSLKVGNQPHRHQPLRIIATPSNTTSHHHHCPTTTTTPPPPPHFKTRGGCQCAGPYSQKLLGLTRKGSDSVEGFLVNEKLELLR